MNGFENARYERNFPRLYVWLCVSIISYCAILYPMNKLLFIVIVIFILAACSRERTSATGDRGSSGGNVAGTSQQQAAAVGGSFALELIPREATRSSTLHLVSRGVDLSRVRIDWLLNGKPFTTIVPTQFNGTDAAKGDTVQSRVIVQDQAVLSNIVQIMNSPPEIIRVKILPDVFRPGDTLNVEVEGSDIDEDGVTYLYEWTRNGEPAGNGKGIEGAIKRGDKIEIKIMPFDGENYGKSVHLQRAIKNLPPMIVEHNEFSFDGTIYTYQVKANDPDGDALTFSLASPPAGMTLDSSTGLLKWTVPTEFNGVQEVMVLVQDGNGGAAQYTLKITIR